MPKHRVGYFLLVTLLLSLIVPTRVQAIPAEYAQCVIGEACPIGEFLYDDDYAPITTAFCHITTRDSTGTLILNNAAMSANGDGWYEYDVSTASASLDTYRTQVCCTAGPDYLCMDKTYQITADTDLTAEDVENAVLDADLSDHTTSGSVGGALNSTLSSLASMVSDIWTYSSRSLTSFGTLITDIWNYSSRTFTGVINIDSTGLATKTDIQNQTATISGYIDSSTNTTATNISNQTNEINTTVSNQTNELDADNSSQTTTLTSLITSQTSILQTTIGGDSSADLETIKQQIAYNKTLLEALLEDPVLNPGDTSSIEALSAKLDQALDYLNQLYANTQQVISRLGLILLNWDNLTPTDISNELSALLSLLGSDPNSQTYNSSILYQLSWFSESWPNSVTENAYHSAQETISLLTQVQNLVDINNTSSDTKSYLDDAFTSLTSIELLLGNLNSTAGSNTLFGLIKTYQSTAMTLKQARQSLLNLLANWSTYNHSDLTSQLQSLEDQIISVNLIPKYNSILENDTTNQNESLKNRAAALLALIDLNQHLLVNTQDQPLSVTWLETSGDSVLFRTAIFNPSFKATQNYDLSYDLPKEITLDDVTSLGDQLTKSYDQASEKVVINGHLSLNPRQLALDGVKVTDYWHISSSRLDSLRTQAADLLASLKGTSYFTRASQLKSDIDTLLTDIQNRQGDTGLVSDRIAAFRQSLLDLQTVDEYLAELSHLVDQATSTGSIMGFVGSVQAITVLGILAIIIAAFVFLTMYMRLLHRQEVAHHPQTDKSITTSTPLTRPLESIITQSSPLLHLIKSPPQKTIKRPKPNPDAYQKLFHLVVIGLSSAALSSMTAGSLITLNKPSQDIISPVPDLVPTGTVQGTSDPVRPTSSPTLPANPTLTANSTPITITVPEDTRINVREQPDKSAPILTKLVQSTPAIILKQADDWVLVEFTLQDEPVQGWLHQSILNN